jgi:uncharacterized protein (TIGR03437 family)
MKLLGRVLSASFFCALTIAFMVSAVETTKFPSYRAEAHSYRWIGPAFAEWPLGVRMQVRLEGVGRRTVISPLDFAIIPARTPVRVTMECLTVQTGLDVDLFARLDKWVEFEPSGRPIFDYISASFGCREQIEIPAWPQQRRLYLAFGVYELPQGVAVMDVDISVLIEPATTRCTVMASPATLAFTVEQRQTFVEPRQVRLTSSGCSPAFTARAVTNQGGDWLYLSPDAGSIPVTLSVSVRPGVLLAGTYSAVIEVVAPLASNSPLRIPVTMEIGLPGCPFGLDRNSIVGAAAFEPSALSPGGFATIVGRNFGPASPGCLTAGDSRDLIGSLAYEIDDVRVSIGGWNAPIWKLCSDGAGQAWATVQIPEEIGFGETTLTLTRGSRACAVNGVQLREASPGIFERTMSDGKRRAVLVKSDGTFVSLENRARRRERLRALVYGLGPTTPAAASNSVAGSAFAKPIYEIVLGVNNAGVPIESVGRSRTAVGVFEIEFNVPSDVPTSTDVNLVVAVNVGGVLIYSNPSSFPVE